MGKSQELAQLGSYINVNTQTNNIFFGPTISPTVSIDTNSGIITSSSLDATNVNLTNINSSGIATLGSQVSVAGDISVTGDSTVTGDSIVSGNSSVTGILTVSQSLDVNGAVDVSGLATLNDANISGVSTFVGVATFGGGLRLNKFATERLKNYGISYSSPQQINLEDGMVHLFQGNSGGSVSRSTNLRYNATTSLNSIVKIGECFSVIIVLKEVNFVLSDQIQIDGTNVATYVYAANGNLPPSANANTDSKRDVYTLFVMRVAENGSAGDWNVLYNYVKYS